MNTLHYQLLTLRDFLESEGFLKEAEFIGGHFHKYSYRYSIKIRFTVESNGDYVDNEENIHFIFIKEALIDGVYNELSNEEITQYRKISKPSKLIFQWHIRKSDYVAYLWFDDMKIRDAFEWFYTKYPDAKMDFIFHIDTENKVFQISFNCVEADEPMLLSEDTYQMIIFKSKFEYYRTPNYNQQRGAWIW